MKSVETLLQYVEFVANAFAVESCSSSDALFQGDVEQQVHPEAGGTGVANAHFANADDVATLLIAFVNQFASDGKTTLHLCLCHCRFVQEIATPVRAYLSI